MYADCFTCLAPHVGAGVPFFVVVGAVGLTVGLVGTVRTVVVGLGLGVVVY